MMLPNYIKNEYYQALLNKNTFYEGVFYVGVKTTGVFCRPTCPARKPKFENYEFYQTAQAALLASFRPCKRCRPLSHPNQVLPSPIKQPVQVLKTSWLDTPLGLMVAIASDDALYLLEFVDRRGLERAVERLRQRTKSAIIPGSNAVISSIEQELKDWFDGTLKDFKTPLLLLGSPFQKSVWEQLSRIPYGETRSYLEQAVLINKPSACRAVANANGANQLAIVIPCHRIINSNGDLGGYGGGIVRKQWLLDHEKQYKS